jgi:hypothetical protein
MADAKAETSAEEKEVRIKPDLEKYVNGVSGSGKKTKNCGDEIAAALDGFTVEEIRAVASKMTDVTQKDLEAKYEHLNVGMQIMNLRNRIRGAVNKLDKAHEADKAVVPGLKTLSYETEKGTAAVTKRRAAQAKAAEDRTAKAEANAKAKAEKPAKGKAKKAA